VQILNAFLNYTNKNSIYFIDNQMFILKFRHENSCSVFHELWNNLQLPVYHLLIIQLLFWLRCFSNTFNF